MPVQITQTEQGYTAVVTPSQLFGRALAAVEAAKAAGTTPPLVREAWETTEPMTRDDLRAKLLELGVHHLDVEDAFAKSDPNWKPPYEDPDRFRKRTASYVPLPPKYRERTQ